MLSNLDTKVDIFQYCTDTIRSIHRYDQENHTEYLETLYVYIKLAGNITDVGRQMHTHRNTIVHRLERMKELFSVRLSDGEELVRLYVGILILRNRHIFHSGISDTNYTRNKKASKIKEFGV